MIPVILGHPWPYFTGIMDYPSCGQAECEFWVDQVSWHRANLTADRRARDHWPPQAHQPHLTCFRNGWAMIVGNLGHPWPLIPTIMD